MTPQMRTYYRLLWMFVGFGFTWQRAKELLVDPGILEALEQDLKEMRECQLRSDQS